MQIFEHGRKMSRAVAVLALFALIACTHEPVSDPQPRVEQVTQRLTVTLDAPSGDLGETERERIGGFLARGRAGQGGPISITLVPRTPLGLIRLDDLAADLPVAGRADDILLVREIIPGAGDVTVVSSRSTPVTPGCPDWSEPNMINNQSRPSSNFGCATAANLMRMVDDPRDLERGRSLAPQPAPSAILAIDRYNADEVKELPDVDDTFGGTVD